MSFILQALKDSEQERNRIKPVESAEPTRASVGVSLPPKKPVRRLAYIGAFAVIAGAGWYLSNRPAIEPAVQAVPVSASSGTASHAELVPGVESNEPDLRGVKLIINPPETQSRPDASVQPASLTIRERLATAQQPRRTATPVETAEAAATEISPPDPYADLPYLRQLPVSTQREIPELKFSVHIYSESRAGRMVKLNDRMMREGQRVAPDLNIEAIIPRAVVFNYAGQRFKVPAR